MRALLTELFKLILWLLVFTALFFWLDGRQGWGHGAQVKAWVTEQLGAQQTEQPSNTSSLPPKNAPTTPSNSPAPAPTASIPALPPQPEQPAFKALSAEPAALNTPAPKLTEAQQAHWNALQATPSAAGWRALADDLAAAGQPDAAAGAYAQAVQIYQSKGDAMTAAALENLAQPFQQQAQPYLLGRSAPPEQPLARLEPPAGLLLGISTIHGYPHRDPFPVHFIYWHYTQPQPDFPISAVNTAKAHGAALHLALEPQMALGELDDGAIRDFARQVRAAELPVFIRFASEMNDPQNRWSGDPAAYRAGFARFARIIHAEAPNAAMVWMPMPAPLERIEPYYPGADAVDWAGLSLYSAPFRNGDANDPQLRAHPLAQVDAFYRRYSPAHPIQLSEYAASHRSGAKPTEDFSAYAAAKTRETYWGAVLNYPRLKNINWLDEDMFGSGGNGKDSTRLNDYSLFASPAKLKAVQELWQLDSVFRDFAGSQCTNCAVTQPLPFPARLSVSGDLTGMLWLQTFGEAAQVKLLLDGEPMEVEQGLPHRFTLPAEALSSGAHTLEVRTVDESGGLMLARSWTFKVAEE